MNILMEMYRDMYEEETGWNLFETDILSDFGLGKCDYCEKYATVEYMGDRSCDIHLDHLRVWDDEDDGL